MHLYLPAVDQPLLEEAVGVPDAVAPHREVQRGAGLQDAGRQAAEAAVAQRGLRLVLVEVLIVTCII